MSILPNPVSFLPSLLIAPMQPPEDLENCFSLEMPFLTPFTNPVNAFLPTAPILPKTDLIVLPICANLLVEPFAASACDCISARRFLAEAKELSSCAYSAVADPIWKAVPFALIPACSASYSAIFLFARSMSYCKDCQEREFCFTPVASILDCFS